MIQMCSQDCENHVSFPHFVVTIPGNEFIICAICEHWINLPHPRCDCDASCHKPNRIP